MTMSIIKPDQFKLTNWSGGLTREIFIFPPDADYEQRNFTYRISTALVASNESEFTNLPDYERFILPLSDHLFLSINGVPHHLAPFEVLAFDGAAKTTSASLPNLTDLNLMVKKGSHADVEVIFFDQPLKLKVEESQLIIRIQLNAKRAYQSISDAVFKPPGTMFSSRLLKENQLAVIMTLPKEHPAKGAP